VGVHTFDDNFPKDTNLAIHNDNEEENYLLQTERRTKPTQKRTFVSSKDLERAPNEILHSREFLP